MKRPASAPSAQSSKKRTAASASSSKVKVTISGSAYLKKLGLQDALQSILEKLDAVQPANPLQHIQDGLDLIQKQKTSEAVTELAPFPAPGEIEWRKVCKQRSLAAAPDPTGLASIVCNGEDRSFPVNPSDTALVCIDMQWDFLEPDGRVGQFYKDSPCNWNVEGVERLLKACRAKGFTIAHSRSHRYGSLVRDELVGTDDKGYELHPRCAALPGEIVVDKWTYGAFASTHLEAELRKKGVTRILLCGVLTNVCVFATASQAVDRFIRVCLVEDACAAFSKDWHDMALQLINQPQTVKGHKRGCGLYFGEVAKVEKVEEALGSLP